MQSSSRLKLKMTPLILLALMLCGCATESFPQKYYAARNSGDRIASSLKLGMTIDEIRKSVSDSELKQYVKEGSLSSVRSEKEILEFYNYAIYPKNVLDDMKVGTLYRSYSYWITAQTNVTLYLFFDESERLHGWANYPSRFNYERYWHERLTSKLRVRTEKKGMTRAEVYALLGSPLEIVDLPTERSRSQYMDHVWLSYNNFLDPPVRDIVKKLEVYSYPLVGGGERRVYLGYTEFPRFKYQFVSKKNPRTQVPNPDYLGPQQDELTVWGYDHAWEEGERYMRYEAQQKK
nr:hypothetical protein [uncultured Undibacterium sp.]